jgi:hypothetical protein
MRFSAACTAAATVAFAIGPGCGIDGDDAQRALDDARKAALQADYLSVRQSGRKQLLFGRGVTVRKRRGRVVVWEDGHQSFTSSAGRRCFERDTEFDRRAAGEVRRGAAPPNVREARFIDRHGSRVLRARERHTDFADTEFELRVDKSGRPRSMRSRSARFGVLPPRRWFYMRYEFLTAAEFDRRAGDPPSPRCR